MFNDFTTRSNNNNSNTAAEKNVTQKWATSDTQKPMAYTQPHNSNTGTARGNMCHTPTATEIPSHQIIIQ